MFGVIDRIFVLFGKFFPWKLKGMTYLKEKKNVGSKEVWVCFIPFFSYNTSRVRKKMIPQNSSVILYIFPKIPVFPDPRKTKKFLDRVYVDASEEILKIKKSGKKVNLLFHSLPTVLIGKLVKRFKNYLERLEKFNGLRLIEKRMD